jgi:hypothetical protein
VESKWKNYHITTFPGQCLSKTLEEAMDLSQDRLILELEAYEITLLSVCARACVSPPIVARQRIGKNPLIVARQRLGENPPVVAR